MESLFAWAQYLADWIARLIPKWTIVPATHGWVKFVAGSQVESGGAGIIWHWPARTELHTYPIARQTLDLRAQTVATKDDRALLVGGLITYRIKSIEQILAHTWDPDETIKDSALTAIHEVVSRLTYEELRAAEGSGALNLKLRSAARRVLRPYGVHVMKMTVTDLAPTRVYKLVVSTDTVT